MEEMNLPEQFRPLSPWAYFGYTILFGIPLIGLICLIVFALDNSNINRRNFARGYFVSFLIALIFIIVLAVLGVFTSIIN